MKDRGKLRVALRSDKRLGCEAVSRHDGGSQWRGGAARKLGRYESTAKSASRQGEIETAMMRRREARAKKT